MSVGAARPRVSVIIPTHNRSSLVRTMLDQLLRPPAHRPLLMIGAAVEALGPTLGGRRPGV